MSIFDFFRKNKDKEKNISLNYAPTSSGTTPINLDYGSINIYASDIVMQSIRCKANEFKKLQPRHIRTANGLEEVITTSPVAKILKRPNPYMTQSDFLERITILLELNKNVYIYPDYYINRAGEKVYTSIYPLKPSEVDVLVDAGGRYFFRMMFANGYKTTLPMEDVIHWKKDYGTDEYFGGNGWMDVKGVQNAIGYYDTMLKSIAKALAVSCNINGIMRINSYMSDDKIDAENEAFKKRIQNNESSILFTDLKTEYTNIPRDVKLVDSETVKFLYENIIRANGTSLAILSGDYTKAQKEAYYEHALEADIKSLGEAFSKVLFSDRESSFGNEVIFYPRSVVFMSMENKLSALSTGLPAGVFTINEARELLGYAPVEGGDVRPRGYNSLDNSNDETTPDSEENAPEAQEEPLENEGEDDNG